MAGVKPKLLIIEDDLESADTLTAYFRVQAYEVLTANWGEDGVRTCQASHPDLIILDIHLPDIDGYEVAGRLRSNRRTADIPIIFMTDKRDHTDRLTGFELGVDDYINKPFDLQELRLRVRNVLRRASHNALNNPVTSLPDGALVDERLDECLQRSDWSMLVVSLENLDLFRETYGFVASDEILRAVGTMVNNAIHEIGASDDFFGHLGPANFVIITRQDRAAILQTGIRSRLERSLDYFYPIKDREKSMARAKRLVFKLGTLGSGDGPFASIDVLKASLLRKRQ